MFADWTDRKRGRDDEELEDYENGIGFGEHRSKRRIAILPHRTSPSFNRHSTPPACLPPSNYGTPSAMVAGDSGLNMPTEPGSSISPYTISPERQPSYTTSNLHHSPELRSSTPTTYSHTEDLDMLDDTMHISPSASQSQDSPSLSGRIPTPIHSSFAPFPRASKGDQAQEDHYADDEALVNRFKRGRRLPSPISEGEMSPSILVDGMEDMQMEVDRPATSMSQRDTLSDLPTPTKKGHQRSKHSLRQWSGYGGDLQSAGQGVRRSFSMGYRSDCEKCRLKVPGHFSHIITYSDDHIMA